MNYYLGNTMVCSCSQLVPEIDTLYCSKCGDVACYDCYIDCTTCGKLYCKNCSATLYQCATCFKKAVRHEKVYIVIKGQIFPVRNGDKLLGATNTYYNANGVTLELNNKRYAFKYRTLHMRDDNSHVSDYFVHFEEIEPIELLPPNVTISGMTYDEMMSARVKRLGELITEGRAKYSDLVDDELPLDLM